VKPRLGKEVKKNVLLKIWLRKGTMKIWLRKGTMKSFPGHVVRKIGDEKGF
jgi:hypothetical protein